MQPGSLASVKRSTLNVHQKEHVVHGLRAVQSVKKKLINLLNWAGAIVAALVIAKTAAGVRRAAKHPNPEMWE